MKRILLFVFLLIVPLFGLAKEYITPSGIKISIEEPQVEWKLSTKEYTLPSGLRYVVEELVAIPRSLKYAANNFIPIAKAAEMTLKDEILIWIKSFSQLFIVNEKLMVELGICESNLNPNAIGDKGLSINIYQWQEKSWNFYNKKYGWNLDRTKWQDQVQMTARVASDIGIKKDWYNCSQFIKYHTWDKSQWK